MPHRSLIILSLALPASFALSTAAVGQTLEQWECVDINGNWACAPERKAGEDYQPPVESGSTQPTQASTNERAITPINLDWIPRDALTDDMAAHCPRGCEGAYVSPLRQDQSQLENPAQAEVNAEAGLMEIDGATGTKRLSEGVIFTQGWRQVAADEVIVGGNTDYQLNGDITIREPNLLLTGDSATIQADTNELNLSNAQYVMHDLRVQGEAEHIRRAPDGHIYIDNATYSTCEPINQDWRFVAEEIEIDPENSRIIARNMRIKAGPVTLFYAPRFSFPLGDNRKSGLLYPVFENSGDNGLDMAQPIYLNLAPNYDLTLTPRFIEERGAMLESQFRWLNSRGGGSLDTAILGNDRGGTEDTRQGDDRWYSRLLASRDSLGGTLFLDYSAVSDRDYFSDLGTASLENTSQTWLDRRLTYRREGPLLDFSLTALSYQDLTRNELRGFNELPRIQFSSNWQSAGNFYLQTLQELVAFSPLDKRSTPTSSLQSDQFGNWTEGQRLRLDYRTGWRKQSAGLYLDTGVELGYRQYELNEMPLNGSRPNPNFLAGGFFFELGAAFERQIRILDHDWIQTLEPRLQYLRINADDQSELPVFDSFASMLTYENGFRSNRFGGGDRIADANRLSFGLESSVLSANSGLELVRLGIAQQFYFEDREVHLSPRLASGLVDPNAYADDDPRQLAATTGQSEYQDLLRDSSSILTFAEFRLPQNWNTRLVLNWSEHDRAVDYGTLEFGYRAPDRASLINIAYHYEPAGAVFRDVNQDNLVQPGETVDGTIEQLDLSAVLELAEHWTLIGKWQQDVSHSRSLEVLAGARYDACCWSTSLVWRHWLERNDNLLLPEQALKHDNGIFVSFELKGLAGVGERLENMLSGSIPGY